MAGCYGGDVLYIYSPDRSQCITVIDEHEKRCIIVGKHENIPDTGYIYIDKSDIDPLSDVIHVCWNTDRYDWEMVIHNSKIIEYKLDSSKFNFQVSLPKDDKGIPNEKKFRRSNCAIYSYYMKRLSPDNAGAIIEK